MRLSRMSWQAVRSSPRSSDWQMTQLSGRPWSDIASFGRDDLFPNNINSYNDAGGRGSQNQMFTGYVDGKTTLNLGLPVTLQSGWKTRLSTYERRSIDYRLTYVGPTGNSLDPAAVYIEEPLYRLDLKQGTNVESLNLPSVNRAAMYRLYVEHPNYFQTDPFTNFVPTLAGRGGSVKEQTDAGYVEGTSKWKDFRFNLGVRLERTRTVVRTIDIRPPAAVRAAGFTPNTIPFAAYQYRYGERTSKYGDYDNAFWSGGIKYSPTRSLTFQFGASQAIRRQDYAELGGNVVIDDVNRVITLPNPALKPETSDKYFAAAQYYLEPSGVLSLSGYQLQVANLGTSRSAITAAEAGYADDPEYAGYAFQQSLNLSGIRKIQGVELEYSQQLVFLPGVFRGLSVFGSVTRVASDVQVVRLVPKAASGGIRFSNHRFNVQLRATWQAASATTIAPTNTEWVYERLTFDLSSGIKLNNTYDFTLTGRNISNAPKQSYSNEPGRIAKSAYFGAVWTIGLRGKF
jgi:TonB-dependent receptor